MIVWMLYVIAVSALLSAAAVAAERACRAGRRPTRGIWLAAIVASLLLPTMIASVSIQLPQMTASGTASKALALKEVTSLRLIPDRWMKPRLSVAADAQQEEVVLRRAWLAASAGLALLLVFMGVQVYRRKRSWRAETVDGTAVYVTPDMGPAVVGLIRPCIVVPQWLLEAPSGLRAAVMTHEQAHIQAHDPLLFSVALGLLIAMPWNFPLWWNLHRLRRAIEVDCDARVLGRGHDVRQYGEALIVVGQRQRVSPGVVAAMSESSSFLEQRITIMMRKASQWSRWSMIGLGGLSLALVAVAAQVSPPNLGEHSELPPIVEVPASTLDRYVGYYQWGDTSVLTISRSGEQLSAQMTGQGPADIYPASDSHFFYKVVNASIDFDTQTTLASGAAASLIIHQNGADITMMRIDAARAQQLAAIVDDRIQSQTATPGSQAVLQRTIDGIVAGNPNYEEMQPLLAAATRKQQAFMQQQITSLGAQRSIQFSGVGNAGWDVYHVTYERGSMDWRIQLDSQGIITGLLVMASP